MIGSIFFVGGDPLANRLRSIAGVVTVFDLHGKIVAHMRVGVGHSFRFKLSPGRYKLTINPSYGCPPEIVQIRADRTTRVNADTGCNAY